MEAESPAEAQTKAMKKAAGSVRIDLAQYREMEVFTQFSSDLDDDTRRQLVYGQSLMRLLRQPRSHPYSLTEQVILLVSALGRIQQELPPERIAAFNTALLSDFVSAQPQLLARLTQTAVLTDEDREAILTQARKSLHAFLSADGGAQG